ncbi:hypothetical protein OESDEN_02092 [Oesophagostomum dentatum]|uniref:RSE1/DDB1/CPSF1 C-terminal domain-containing protein n=1 Tax=Oesophagostomum dentatum TaxID=61180 RepID=A0A0B1TP74_OESDE|nr:hypothetical protein OESDEN_02092 [Oesophagostomum dentatum]
MMWHHTTTIRLVVYVGCWNFPVQITGIQSTGQRIIVTDSQESVHFVRYRKAENQLVIFCDDTTPRYVTTCCVLDYNTVAVGDKFGSISIVSSMIRTCFYSS